MTKTYKALLVQASTHKKVKREAVKRGVTIDQLINTLLLGTV